MIKALVFLASAAVLVVAHHEGEEVVQSAIVHLVAEGVEGNVTFTTQPDGNVRVTGRIVGLAPGLYGFHVHEKGNINAGCGGALGHFNPEGKPHGHPQDKERHVGDLGNVEFNANKETIIDFVDPEIKLSGRHNILGRALVLHGGTDDYGKSEHPDSKKTGNAGGRVACGVIGILESTPAGPGANSAPVMLGSLLTFIAIIPFLL